MTDPASPISARPSHPQDLEFEKHLKALLQKTKRLYKTPTKTLNRISLIVSRSQHSTAPTQSIVKKVHRLSTFKPDFIQYFTHEVSALFAQKQQSISSSGKAGSSHLLDEQMGYKSNQKLDTDCTLEDANGDTSMDSSGQGDNSIYNNNNSGSGSGGSDTDNHDISDLRSTLPSKRILEGPQMTLEGRQLQKLLQYGQPSLIQEIRQHIGHHDTFQSFLELLTMYDAHLIDHLELVRRTSPFLGRDQYLLDRFKQGILDDRVDDDADTRVNDTLTMSPSMQPSPSYSTPSTTKHNSNNSDADSTSAISVMSSGSLPYSNQPMHRNKDNSTSYRWIPKALRNENCSGRDDTCWEVLNDEYVSHPTWASEDNGFLSSNKSKSEEKLHQVEDERYALDIEISINWDALTMMKEYMRQILALPVGQQQKVKICPENDGFSPLGYTQVIKKLYYTHDKQKQALKSLLSSPATALPGFIKLMKQRDADLRDKRNGMLPSWNETVANNYYKFLDYQWESNKSEGRKTFTTQQLVTEIDALWHEQQLQTTLKRQRERSQQSLNEISTTESSNPSRPVLSLPSPQLVYAFRDPSIIDDICDMMLISSCEQGIYNPKDTATLQRFIVDFIPPLFGLPPRTNSSTDSGNDNISSTAIRTTKTSAQTRSQQQRNDDPKDRGKKQRPKQHFRQENRLFIGNEHWYCMIRYFQMIYDSLAQIKSIDEKYRLSPLETKRNCVALVDLEKKSHLLALVKIDLSQGYYSAALEIIRHYLTGKLGQLDLEDGIRYLFGVQAYVIFSIGNTLSSLIRQVYDIATHDDLEIIFELFQRFQPYRPKAVESVLRYRAEAAAIGTKAWQFIMVVDVRLGQLRLQIIGDNEVLFPELTKEYLDYLESFKNRKRKTTGVKRKGMNKVFLERTLEKEDQRRTSNIYLHQGLKYEICQTTYHMGFVEDTEDAYIREAAGLRKKRK